MSEETVLDATCGMRSIWHDDHKDNPYTLYCDLREREEGWHGQSDRYDSIEPDLICDYRELPFEDERFDLVIWDPPHMTTSDGMERLTGYVTKKYGALHAETWQSDLRKGFEELWRVLRGGGSLTFKFSSCSISQDEVLEVFPVSPLVGTTTNKMDNHCTRWYVFHKFAEDTT